MLQTNYSKLTTKLLECWIMTKRSTSPTSSTIKNYLHALSVRPSAKWLFCLNPWWTASHLPSESFYLKDVFKASSTVVCSYVFQRTLERIRWNDAHQHQKNVWMWYELIWLPAEKIAIQLPFKRQIDIWLFPGRLSRPMSTPCSSESLHAHMLIQAWLWSRQWWQFY